MREGRKRDKFLSEKKDFEARKIRQKGVVGQGFSTMPPCPGAHACQGHPRKTATRELVWGPRAKVHDHATLELL